MNVLNNIFVLKREMFQMNYLFEIKYLGTIQNR